MIELQGQIVRLTNGTFDADARLEMVMDGCFDLKPLCLVGKRVRVFVVAVDCCEPQPESSLGESPLRSFMRAAMEKTAKKIEAEIATAYHADVLSPAAEALAAPYRKFSDCMEFGTDCPPVLRPAFEAAKKWIEDCGEAEIETEPTAERAEIFNVDRFFAVHHAEVLEPMAALLKSPAEPPPPDPATPAPSPYEPPLGSTPADIARIDKMFCALFKHADEEAAEPAEPPPPEFCHFGGGYYLVWPKAKAVEKELAELTSAEPPASWRDRPPLL